MKYRFLLVSILALIPTLIPAFGQTGLYSYDGGYFLRNGSHWEEYRPDYKTGVWASYEQYNEEANFFNIKNSACSVSVPKTASANFFYAKPGEDWTQIYTTSEIYDYLPDFAKDIYCYNGGYFVRDGMDWYEYRPAERHEVWNEYKQVKADGNFIYLKCNDNDFMIGIPLTASLGSIYIKRGDGDWSTIYTLTGIYDCGKGYEYSIPFRKMRTENDSDSLLVDARININSDGTCQVRYSDKKYPFEFSSYEEYESTDFDAGSMFLMWIFGASSDREGFVLYKDDDKTNEVLSYIINADGKIACTVRGIPGLPATEFWSCKDSDPGDDIHIRVILEDL